MKDIVKKGYIITSIIFMIYLVIPNQPFPENTKDSLQSDEPADTEDENRRAYFTNYDRNDTVNYYSSEMQKKVLSLFNSPQYGLNYPPEEAQTIIRDQTRSTYLEEIVHPFRESLYINGFEPRDPKDAIFIQDKHWRQKIIIKKVESSVYMRLMLGFLCVLISPVVFGKLLLSLKDFRKDISKLWIYR